MSSQLASDAAFIDPSPDRGDEDARSGRNGTGPVDGASDAGEPSSGASAGHAPRASGDPATKPAADAPVVERRARSERRAVERRVASVPVPVDRRKGGERRAQADRREQGKRGGEYDLDADTLEFIGAVNRFKEATGKTFPTWSDLLGIVRDLGYEKHNS